MEIKLRATLRRLAIVGLLAAAPVAAFAQAAPAPDAKPAPTSEESARVHPPWPGTHTAGVAVAPPATPTAKSISEKGVKKTESAPDAAALTPPVEAGKGHSEKGIK